MAGERSFRAASRRTRPDPWTTLAVLASIAAGIFGAERCVAGHLFLGYSALGVSVVGLAAAGFGRAGFARPIDTRPSAAAALVVLAALVWFRCYRLVPPGLWGDDALNGLLAYDVLDGVIASPFELVRHSHSYFHALSNYAIAGAFHLFGASLETLRLPGIAAGCIAGLCVYGIARQLFGRATALFCGLLFASAPIEIAHSKSLIQVVIGLMFQTAGVYAFVRGLRAGSTSWMIAAAISLAGTVYTYHAAKIAPLVLLPLVVAELRRPAGDERDDPEGTPPGNRRRNRRGLCLAGLVFALCLLPAGRSYWRQPTALTDRAQRVTLTAEMRESGSLRPLAVSAVHTLGIFHVEQGPEYHWFGPGGDPALTLVAAALVLHGLALSIWRWRQPRHQLLLFWFAIGLAPAVLSTEAPRAYRALFATPPVFIWAAMPLSALWRNAAPGPVSRTALRTLAAALIAASLTFDFHYYFYRTYTHPAARWTVGERLVELARVVRDAGEGWTGYLMSPTFAAQHESLRLLSRMWQLDLTDAASLHDALSIDPLPRRGAIYLTTRGSHAAHRALRGVFANTIVHARVDPRPTFWQWGGFWPYQPLQRQPQPVVLGLQVPTESLGDERRGHQQLPIEGACESWGTTKLRREPILFYEFFPDTFNGFATCRWTATLVIPPHRPRIVQFRDNLGLEVAVDGAPYAATPLSPGPHQLLMEARIPRRRFRLRVYWKAPEGARELVPASAWKAARPATERVTPDTELPGSRHRQ